MMDAPSPLDRDLAEGLERLADLARVMDEKARFEEVDGARRLRAVSRADGLSIEIELRSDTLWVDLAGWRQQWRLGDEDSLPSEASVEPREALAEACDLVAAIVTGRLFVEERSKRGRPFERRVLWSEAAPEADAGRVVGTVRLGAKPWWGAVERRRLRQLGTLPPDLRRGDAGTHPTAPWLGLLEPAGGLAPSGAPLELAIDGELDLHTFAPKQVGKVVEAYLEACRQQGVTELRIVHGKGIGNLRRTVHAILDRHPDVDSYRLGGHAEGSWGATLVTLRSADKSTQ